jgi:hypothetical protein
MPLVNTGLVCRYYFDEAASGSTPTQVDDTSGNAYHLTEINYGGGNLAWNEISGNRGLESTSTSGTQRARRSVNNTSDALRDALAGTAVVTFELVLDVHTGNASTARVCAINDRIGGSPVVGVAATNTSYRFYWNGSALTDIALSAGRHVLHFVIDTGLGSNQYKLYIDGTNTNNNSATGTLTIGSNVDLICFNRETGGPGFERSFDGVLYYAAIYDAALSDADVTTNYDILTLDDDEPAGGGGGTINEEVLEDTISVTDQPLDYVFFNRRPESFIALSDEMIATLVGTIAKIMTDTLDVTDGSVFSVYRNRLLQDTIILSEGPTEQYITTNIVADDVIDIVDSVIRYVNYTRLGSDSLVISDSLISAVINYVVNTAVLSSTLTVTDQASWFVYYTRLVESAIALTDQSLSQLQRFILLTDLLSVDDSATATYVPDPGTPGTVYNPVIRIGFDQPRIDIGGYSLH